MTCQCAERRAAFKRAREATQRGNLEAARMEMVFIAQTSYEDMRDALNRKSSEER